MTPRERADQPLESSLERYLQDKGKGRGGDGGNYRRNAARELKGFTEWTSGDRGDDELSLGIVQSICAWWSRHCWWRLSHVFCDSRLG